jgi:uncharacterized coiled-coil DUF342 family protein
MAEVADLADTYDGAVARLHQLTEHAHTGRDHLAQQMAQSEQRRATLDQTRTLILGHLASLQQVLQESHDRFAGDHLDAVVSLGQVEETVKEHSSTLSEASQQTSGAIINLRTEIQAGQETLRAELEGTRDEFTQSTEAATELGQQVRTAQDEAHQVFQTLLQQCEQLHQQLDALQSDATAAVARVGEHVAQAHTARVETLFAALSTDLSQQQRATFASHFSASESTLTEVFRSFTDHANTTATTLSSRASEVLQGLERHCADTLQQEMRGVLNDAVENAVRELLQEIGVTTMIMQTGASITSAMAPILPELAAAKLAVGTINDALDAVNNLKDLFRF